MINDPNMHARGSLQWIDHPEYGRIVVSHSPMRYDGTPLVPLRPSSGLGADSSNVLEGWLGSLPGTSSSSSGTAWFDRR